MTNEKLFKNVTYRQRTYFLNKLMIEKVLRLKKKTFRESGQNTSKSTEKEISRTPSYGQIFFCIHKKRNTYIAILLFRMISSITIFVIIYNDMLRLAKI